jgi:plastocyanin
MFTPTSKLFAGLSAVSFVAAVVYGISTTSSSAALLGTIMFVGLGVLGVALTAASVANRDGDVAADPGAAGGDAAQAAVSSASPSYWPTVGAFGVAAMAAGLVAGTGLFVLGIVLVLAAFFEWTIQAWADRSSTDPAVNRQRRNKLMAPLEVPLAGVLVIALIVLGFSRVFLSLDHRQAAYAFIAFGMVVLLIAVTLALRPTLRRNAIAAVIVVSGVAVLAGGVAGAQTGERTWESKATTCKPIQKKDAVCEVVLHRTKGKPEFKQQRIVASAGIPFRLTLINEDTGVKHNIHITGHGADFKTTLAEGKAVLDVTLDQAGVYSFVSDDDPSIKGEIKVLA